MPKTIGVQISTFFKAFAGFGRFFKIAADG
jgi:hypothetical protein